MLRGRSKKLRKNMGVLFGWFGLPGGSVIQSHLFSKQDTYVGKSVWAGDQLPARPLPLTEIDQGLSCITRRRAAGSLQLDG